MREKVYGVTTVFLLKVYGVTTVFLFFKRKKEQLQKTCSGEGLLGADPCDALNGLLHQQLLRVV